MEDYYIDNFPDCIRYSGFQLPTANQVKERPLPGPPCVVTYTSRGDVDAGDEVCYGISPTNYESGLITTNSGVYEYARGRYHQCFYAADTVYVRPVVTADACDACSEATAAWTTCLAQEANPVCDDEYSKYRGACFITEGPTAAPTAGPTAGPTGGPTVGPTTGPTASPTVALTDCEKANRALEKCLQARKLLCEREHSDYAEACFDYAEACLDSVCIEVTEAPTAGPTAGPSFEPTAGPTASTMAGPTVGPTLAMSTWCDAYDNLCDPSDPSRQGFVYCFQYNGDRYQNMCYSNDADAIAHD